MSQFVDDTQLLDLMKDNKLFFCTSDDGNNYRHIAPYRALQTPKSKSKSKSNATKKTSSVSKSSYSESKSSYSESKGYANLFEKSFFNPKYVEKDNQRKYVDHSNKGQRILKKDGINVSVENIIILTLMSKTNRGSVRTTIQTIKDLNDNFDKDKAEFQKVGVNTIDDLIALYIGNEVEAMETLAPPKESPKKGLNKSAKNSKQPKGLTAPPKGTVKGLTAQSKSNKNSSKSKLDITGKNIVVTGFDKDGNIGKMITDNGGILKQSVSNKVDLVIAKDVNSDTKKIKDAKEKSIEIISLANFFPSYGNE